MLQLTELPASAQLLATLPDGTTFHSVPGRPDGGQFYVAVTEASTGNIYEMPILEAQKTYGSAAALTGRREEDFFDRAYLPGDEAPAPNIPRIRSVRAADGTIKRVQSQVDELGNRSEVILDEDPAWQALQAKVRAAQEKRQKKQ